MPRNNDRALTVRLPTDLYESLKERAWLLRRLIQRHLDESDSGATPG